MSLEITASSLVAKSSLKVNDEGVIMNEGLGFSKKLTYKFHEIDAILLSPKNELSIQAGSGVFSIAVKPDSPKHRKVIDTLVREVSRAAPGSQTSALPAAKPKADDNW